MNLRDIEYILTAAETGSFAMASQKCHVSQPSLSIQIKKVETQLGQPLFMRQKTGVTLTPFGEDILPHLQAIRDQVATVRTKAAQLTTPEISPLRLGAIATLAPYLFPKIAKQAEENSLSYHESVTADLLRHLEEDRLDVALIALPLQAPDMETISLFQEPLYLAAAESNPYLNQIDKESMTPPKGVRFLVLSDEHCLGQQTYDLCRLDRFRADHAFKATSLETARQLVADSHDITLMPAMARRAGDGLQYHPLSGRYFREIGLIFKARSPKQERIQHLVSLIHEARI